LPNVLKPDCQETPATMSLAAEFQQKLDLAAATPYPPPPFLETERLILRHYHPNDAPRLAAIANDKDVAENLTLPHPYTLDDAKAWIARSLAPDAHGKAPATFCIVPKHGVADGDVDVPADGVALVGNISLAPGAGAARRHSAELGYFLGRAYWGTGFVSEAGFALLAHAFSGAWGGPVPLQRVWAGVSATNEASIRLLVRLGFREEARFRGALVKDGVAVDELVQALTRSDWERNAEESEEEMLADEDEEDDDGEEIPDDDEPYGELGEREPYSEGDEDEMDTEH
jgi:[ribosomal protein S5]-alanine N-acetyltransferase